VARGFETANVGFDEIEARKNSGGGGGGFFFKLPMSGDSATVRFLDDEPDWAWVHELPKGERTKYGFTEVCRDQDPETGQRNGEPCPGCDKQDGKNYRRKMEARLRVIWRNAPVYEEVEAEGGKTKRNYDNVVGHADAVARWTVGKVILEELDGKNATYKGLTNRDYVVTRSGTGLDTSYRIEPATNDEGETTKTPMSENDKVLAADAPEVIFKAPSYDEWGTNEFQGGKESPPADADVNVFRKRETTAV